MDEATLPAIRCCRCEGPVDAVRLGDEHVLCGDCAREFLTEFRPADLRPIRLRQGGPRSPEVARPDAAGAPRHVAPWLTHRPRRRDGAYNRLGVYYHPELRDWVAHLGNPSSPMLTRAAPSPIAALKMLLREIEREVHTFDEEWTP